MFFTKPECFKKSAKSSATCEAGDGLLDVIRRLSELKVIRDTRCSFTKPTHYNQIIIYPGFVGQVILVSGKRIARQGSYCTVVYFASIYTKLSGMCPLGMTDFKADIHTFLSCSSLACSTYDSR
eukprot:m.1346 g.1346  ORF g.1346 m.1346 type:complete len:124 (+) comp6242_c0_seq1:23-394(+)